MSCQTPEMEKPLRVLVVTGGHPFESEPFFEVFDALPGVEWTHAPQPEARVHFRPDGVGEFDTIVCYDMPGITFTGGDPPARFEEPSAQLVADYGALLDRGQGVVYLHHAIASWPAWPDFAEIVGGRFHYQSASLRGVSFPDSGYRFGVRHRIEVVETGHPICAGLEDGFELTDELYLCPVFEDDVVPLMRSSAPFVDAHFYSADQAIRGRMHSREGWHHPPGSDLVAWVKAVGRSPIAYLQFGDGPDTYADHRFRQVLANAIAWASSPAARQWARAAAVPVPTGGGPRPE